MTAPVVTVGVRYYFLYGAPAAFHTYLPSNLRMCNVNNNVSQDFSSVSNSLSIPIQRFNAILLHDSFVQED